MTQCVPFPATRRYPVGLEPVGEWVAETSSATSKSAVSRRSVAMTETALAELLTADLSGLDLVALMIDGVREPVSGLGGGQDVCQPPHVAGISRSRESCFLSKYYLPHLVALDSRFILSD
jgi:hypothetical protein